MVDGRFQSAVVNLAVRRSEKDKMGWCRLTSDVLLPQHGGHARLAMRAASKRSSERPNTTLATRSRPAGAAEFHREETKERASFVTSAPPRTRL